MIYNKLDELSKNTPVLRSKYLSHDYNSNVYIKLEGASIHGSHKGRVAANILDVALATGAINEGTTIVESSSGNLSLALAAECANRKLKFLGVIDPKTSEMTRKVIKLLGGDVYVVQDADDFGSYLNARISFVKNYINENPNSYWTMQYYNENNPLSHKKTALEIYNDFESIGLNYLILPVGTGGLASGISREIHKFFPKLKIIGVDSIGSKNFGDVEAKRCIVGAGTSLGPTHILNSNLYKKLMVSDKLAIDMLHKVSKEEGCLLGGSTGLACAALINIKEELELDDNVLVISSDFGKKYLDTLYDPKWLQINGIMNVGEIPLDIDNHILSVK